MKIPYRAYNLDFATRWPRYVMIHHSYELGLNNGAIALDKPNFQYNKLQLTHYQMYNMNELPYHYVLEKVGDDYHVITASPLLTTCEFLDMDEEYKYCVHVGLLGNYNVDNVDNRLYNVLGYKILAPLIRLFKIKEENILLHSEASYDPDQRCPGINFIKAKMYTALRAQIKKKSITKGV